MIIAKNFSRIYEKQHSATVPYYMNKKISLIVIIGPTASGKSEFAIHLAKKFNGEIISADSRQCYRNLTIGTAKVNGKWKKGFFLYKGIPHFCIDSVSPKRMYTAAIFKKDAQSAIKAITARRHVPIIAGGTAFWINALVYDIDFPHVSPNQALRKKLEKKSCAQLLACLKKMDPRRAAYIEQKNPRRLIRAIEIAKTFGSVPPMTAHNPYCALWIGISRTDSMLRRSIAARSKQMVKQGLIEETKKLLAAGIAKKRIHEFGFEYIAALDVIEKKLAKSQLVETLTQKTVSYAKRQMRWFSHNSDIQWVSSLTQAEQFVRMFLRAPI